MRNIPYLISICSLHFLLLLSCRQPPVAATYQIQKSASSSEGMVVSAHPLATQAGVDILEKGGNAADAAITVQLALAVVHPRAGNLGGGGFMIYRDSLGKVYSLDFREKAPLASKHNMFLDSAGNVIPMLSREGGLAVGVPGTVAGLVATHKKLGKLPWKDLFQSAILLAKNGYSITQLEADYLNEFQDVFRKLNPPAMPFLADDVWKEGDVIVQKDLASTLETIAEQGQAGFYQGDNSRQLLKTVAKHQGIISQEDLDAYLAIWRKPWTIRWREYEIHSMGSPSSGGLILGQILTMIDDKIQPELGRDHPANVHLITEASRRAFENRARFLGDADFYPVPLDSLSSKSYIQDQFADFDPSKATASQLIDFRPVRTRRAESTQTTHLSVVDRFGNAASVTTTLNDNYGSKVWVEGGGYFLNNEMDDFITSPGTPNLFGLVGSEANAVMPMKRMLSSMTPVIVEHYNKVVFLAGSRGGPMITSNVLHTFLNVFVYKMSVDDAVQAPRYHHQYIPDEIKHEPNAFPEETFADLRSKGHLLKEVNIMGEVAAIYIDEEGVMHGAADKRGDDHAMGVNPR